MKERLEAIKKAALEKIEQADAMDSLNDIRVSVLGKKGELTQVLKGMKDVAKEERPIVGQMVNDTRAVIEEALEKEMKQKREENVKRIISEYGNQLRMNRSIQAEGYSYKSGQCV